MNANDDLSPVHEFARLRKALPREARVALKELLASGTAGCAVEIFYFHLPEKLRGPVLLCLRHWGASPDELRACIRHFWKADSRSLLNAPGVSPQKVREMFRMAKFPVPAELRSPVRVWRGRPGEAWMRRSKVCARLWMAMLPAGSRCSTKHDNPGVQSSFQL